MKKTHTQSFTEASKLIILIENWKGVKTEFQFAVNILKKNDMFSDIQIIAINSGANCYTKDLVIYKMKLLKNKLLDVTNDNK